MAMPAPVFLMEYNGAGLAVQSKFFFGPLDGLLECFGFAKEAAAAVENAQATD